MRRTFWIYGTGTCPYCDKAKELLESHGFGVVYIDVNATPNARDPSWKTVPQIFEVRNYIGGYQNLLNYLQSELEAGNV